MSRAIPFICAVIKYSWPLVKSVSPLGRALAIEYMTSMTSTDYIHASTIGTVSREPYSASEPSDERWKTGGVGAQFTAQREVRFTIVLRCG